MLIKDQFYNSYDKIVPTIFQPYEEFLDAAARDIPRSTRTVCDLGIGTGNFSLKVKKYLPNVKLQGIDMDPRMVEHARRKLPDAVIETRDIFDGKLPKVDYFITSLTTHHFDSETRRDKFEAIAANCKGFLNVDMILSKGLSFEEAISIITKFASQYYNSETLEQIAEEIRSKDNPDRLEDQLKHLGQIGMRTNIIAKKDPFVAYHAFY